MAKEPWAPPTAAKIIDMWSDCVDDLVDLRRNFLFNSSFVHGQQHVTWSDTDATISLTNPISQQEMLARSTVNKIKPRFRSLLARLTKTPLAFEPRPEGIDSYAVQLARLARQVLEVKAHRDQWARIRRTNVANAWLGGSSAISVEPAYLYKDEPITDPVTGEKIKMPSRPATKLTALAINEFGLEPGTRESCDARWWIRNTTLTPKQAMLRYELEEEPPTDAESNQSAMHRLLRANRRSRSNAKTCQVLVYYEAPTDVSAGCVVHVLGNKVVQQDGWTFPFKELNLTTFVAEEIEGTWKGDTILNDARQIQVLINKAFTSINANLGRTDNIRLLLPMGSVIEGDDEFTGNAGEVIRYDAGSGPAPAYLDAPDISGRGLRDHIEKLESELDDLFSTHAVTQGVAPGDRNSGLALSILAEKDETPLGLFAEDQQRGWQKVAEQVLRLEKHLMSKVDQATQAQDPNAPPMQVSDVMVQQTGAGTEPHDVTWSAADLPDNPVVHVPLEAVMPRSQAAVQDMMIKLSQNPAFTPMFQQFNPAQMATILQVPDATAFAYVKDPQIAEATWENAQMLKGADETTVPIQSWQAHAVHIQEHNNERSGSGYRQARQEYKDFIDLHVQAHERLLAEEMAQQQADQLAQAQQMAAASVVPQPQGETK